MKTRFPGTGVSTVRLAGIDWTEQYNCYRTTIAGWLQLGFAWGDLSDRNVSGYGINVAGRKLKTRGKDPEDAARLAVSAARALITKTLADLPETHV